MAPIGTLLEAVEARAAALQRELDSAKGEVAAITDRITAKRAEKTVVGNDEANAMLKEKTVVGQNVLAIEAAKQHVDKALAKITRAHQLSLDRWDSLHEETIKLSDFAKKRLSEDPKALERLKGVCGSSEVVLDKGAIKFAGDKAVVAKLTEAITGMESSFELSLEGDEFTLKLMETRGELQRYAKRYEVQVAREGPAIWITGPPSQAQSYHDLVVNLLSGVDNIDCPKKLLGPAKAQARATEAESGCIIEVVRDGGWGGAGVMHIRGDADAVREAAEAMRAWLDEKEGAVSEFVDVAVLFGGLDKDTKQQLFWDLETMGNKFRISARGHERGEVELRGKADDIKAARAELTMMLDYYKTQQSSGDGDVPATPDLDW